MERELIDHCETGVTMVAEALTLENHSVAVELASLPGQIRGFGHVKEANINKVRSAGPRILARFEQASHRSAPAERVLRGTQ